MDMDKFIIIAIQDFPDIPIGWRYSYIVGYAPTKEEAVEMAHMEIDSRGGKYGCVIYDAESGKEEAKLSRRSHENSDMAK